MQYQKACRPSGAKAIGPLAVENSFRITSPVLRSQRSKTGMASCPTVKARRPSGEMAMWWIGAKSRDCHTRGSLGFPSSPLLEVACPQPPWPQPVSSNENATNQKPWRKGAQIRGTHSGAGGRVLLMPISPGCECNEPILGLYIRRQVLSFFWETWQPLTL